MSQRAETKNREEDIKIALANLLLPKGHAERTEASQFSSLLHNPGKLFSLIFHLAPFLTGDKIMNQ